MKQLPLAVRLKSALTFATFIQGPNEALVHSLRTRIGQSDQAPFWMWSVGGAGRSHLLQALCHESTARGFSCVYLPLSDDQVSVEMLEGLEQLSLVCIDDVDARIGVDVWEKALFRLYVLLQENGGNLLLSAGVPPAGLSVQLKDLLSRFQASEIWHLHPLTESDQSAALAVRAQQLGLSLSEPVRAYIRTHAPRELAALCDLLDELDTKALAEQRAITVAMVREVLRD